MASRALTTCGWVEGDEVVVDGRPLHVYRGIPFAAPPTERRRWRPPEPAAPWSGVRAATSFGPAAPQSPAPPTGLPSATLEVGPTDEDCLTLNAWAPARARSPESPRRRPVLVWLHGGSFMTGSSSMGTYDGARLAAEGGVVVVSANYRLGALGWAPVLGHTNVGLLDQIMALRWVQDNVAELGGDPEQVTVFGESAGGGSVLHLAAMPMAAGLFRRAIAQSGATDLALTPEQSADVAERLVAALRPDDPATAPAEAIVRAQGRVLASVAGTHQVMPYHPVVDSVTVSRTVPEAVGADVDLLLGTTADEMRLFLDQASWTLQEAHLVKRAARYLAQRGITGSAGERVLGAYADLTTPTDQWAALRTDAEMWLPTLEVADAHAGRGGRTYLYRFDWPVAPPKEHLRACHAVDLPFTFGTMDHGGWDAFVGADLAAEALGRAMRRAWVSFARCGDPAGDEIGDWPAYGVERETMTLGRTSGALPDPRSTVRRAWAEAG